MVELKHKPEKRKTSSAIATLILSCLILLTVFCYFFCFNGNRDNKIIFPILKYKFEELQSEISKDEENDEQLEDIIQANNDSENIPIITIILSGQDLAQYSSQIPEEINLAINVDESNKFTNENHFLIYNFPLEKEDITSQKSDEIPNRQKTLEQNTILINNFLDNNDKLIFYGDNDEAFTNEEANALALLEALKNKNKNFLTLKTDKTSFLYKAAEKISFKILTNDVILDSVISVENINNNFSLLESIANSKGFAIASGIASPLTIELLKKWLDEVKDKKIKIIPIDKFNMILEKRTQEITRDFKEDERSR